MTSRTIAITLIMAFSMSTYAQIPNNGFENWSSPNGYNIPDGWGNLNPVTAGANVYTCIKGTPGNPGSAYLRLVSRSVTGMGVQPGIAVSGVLNTITFKPVSGFPYADRPISLKGNWQFMANGGEQGYIAVYLTRWNDVSHTRDTIGKKKLTLSGMVMSWQAFTIPITYVNSETPDSAVIILSASGSVPVSGSYLYVDNLTFFGGTAGLNDPSSTPAWLIYPNPAKEMVTIDFGKTPIKEFTLFNSFGQEMLTKELAGVSKTTIDISKFPAGFYIIKSTDSGKNLSTRFLISK